LGAMAQHCQSYVRELVSLPNRE
jgi:hypothetical protein